MSGIAMSRRSATGARTGNEDATGVGEAPFGWYAILADGVGGHVDGALAAHAAVDAAAARLAAVDVLTPAVVREAIRAADEAVRVLAQGRPGRLRMAATLVVLGIDRSGGHAVWGHVGDSRLYLLRRGRIARVTRDDSLVQQMLDAGWLDAQQAAVHPARHRLLAALGGTDPAPVTVLDSPWPLGDGDALLLCSDGWWEPVSTERIEATLAAATDVDDWLDAMAATIVAHAAPDQDNYSAVAVWIGDPPAVTRLMGA